MISIHYDAMNGFSVPDAGAALYVDAALETAKEFNPENPELFLTVGCESIIDEFRVRVVRKEIKPEQIEFLFTDPEGIKHVLKCTEVGSITPWPYDFCSSKIKAIQEIGRARRSKGANNAQ